MTRLIAGGRGSRRPLPFFCEGGGETEGFYAEKQDENFC